MPSELEQVLEDVCYPIKEEWFDFPGNNSLDLESCLGVPTLYATTRYSNILEYKMRRLGIPSFFKTVLEAFNYQEPKPEGTVSLIMKSVDMKQCGFKGIGSIHELDSMFSRLEIKWKTLQEYLEQGKNMDDLTCDVPIASNDYFLKKRFGVERDLLNVLKSKKPLGNEPQVEKKAHEIVLKKAYGIEDSSGNLSHEQQSFIDRGIKFLLSFALNGVMSENRRKEIHEKVCIHCWKEIIKDFFRGTVGDKFNFTYHLLDSGKEKFHPFRRRAKTTYDEGYIIKKSSHWMWILLCVGMVITPIYILLRKDSDAPIELIINTGIALLALYIAVIPTILFQIIYTGESLGRIFLSNRKVDCQEIFKDKPPQEHADVLEIIRMSSTPPLFLGGINMCYLRNKPLNSQFHCQEEMIFSNLQLCGFALYEDRNGALIMIDKWGGIFQIVISDRGLEKNVRQENKQGTYSNIYRQGPIPEVELEKLSLLCELITLPDQVEILRTEENSDGVPSMVIVSKNSNREHSFFRLLPYGIRKRKFQRFSTRPLIPEVYWRDIRNVDIFKLKIGLHLL